MTSRADPVVGAPDIGPRIPSLDGFRAFSIVLVLIGHASETGNWPEALSPLRGLGNYGVKFFFVISGFLITSLLLKELSLSGSISLKKFYARRTLRVFPALYFYIFVIGALAAAGAIVLMPGDLLHALSYTMNYHHDRAWYLNHTWSLAVEEQFYLLWPSVLVMLGVRRAMAVAAATLLLSPAARVVMWYALDARQSAMTREFQAVADALATGCLLAGTYNWLGRQRAYVSFLRSRWFWSVPVILFVVPPLSFKADPGAFYVFTQSVSNLGAGLCIDRWIRFPGDFIGRALNYPIIVYLGALSYSLYLWQEPFLNPFSRRMAASFPQNLVLSVAAAMLSYHLLEKPCLAIKRRLATVPKAHE
jgi:peptidoglycan/LPS O-acetylase OafA/YrhL